ncbi:hypothetical protein [Caballeronia cordobensis]|uniref:hypothetical protein n=1 Tax=Caballeronia cordobensis TaxID=1353886 RepID=UPI0006AD7F46|nr:hypothetical protein [Caballeronia cordobensis]
MYAMGNYFIEILPGPLPGDGWTGSARFSRRNDYRRHASVTKVTLPSHILMPTMAAAESALAPGRASWSNTAATFWKCPCSSRKTHTRSHP